MNMSYNDYEDQDIDYSVGNGRSREPNSRRGSKVTPQRKRMTYSRSSRPAVSHNGIHRRRNKRTSW